MSELRNRRNRRSDAPPSPNHPSPKQKTSTSHTVSGIYTVSRSHVPLLARIKRDYSSLVNSYRYVIRLIVDLYSLGPALFLLYVLSKLAEAAYPSASIYIASQSMNLIQNAIDQRNIDTDAIYQILLLKLVLVVFTRLLAWCNLHTGDILMARLKQFLSLKLIEAHLQLDVSDLEDPDKSRELQSIFGSILGDNMNTQAPVLNTQRTGGHFGGGRGGRGGRGGHGGGHGRGGGGHHGAHGPGRNLGFGTLNPAQPDPFALINQLTFIVTSTIDLIAQVYTARRLISFDSFDLSLALFGCIDPFLGWLYFGRDRGDYWVAPTNSNYIRLQNIKELVLDIRVRKEILTLGIGDWLVKEYRRCRDSLGDYREIDPVNRVQPLSLVAFIRECCQDLPDILIALRAARTPSHIPMSIASFHLIQQTMTTFGRDIVALILSFSGLADNFSFVRKVYEFQKVSKVGTSVTDAETKEEQMEGCSISIKDVSFKYPGQDKNAVENVNLNLKPGQTCVILGYNGSGKSTLVKLLSLIHQQNEGIITIDGEPTSFSRSYRESQWQQMSVFFQDYAHFPLTVSENISLADLEDNSKDRIHQAASLSGAHFVKSLPDAYDSTLATPIVGYGRVSLESELLKRQENEKRRTVQLSGGQWQKLALARMFYRKGKRLILVDEPSASLDMQAEKELFRNLIAHKGKATTIFVTHRHFEEMKTADLIVFMENGRISWQGSPSELALDTHSDYSKLFRV